MLHSFRPALVSTGEALRRSRKTCAAFVYIPAMIVSIVTSPLPICGRGATAILFYVSPSAALLVSCRTLLAVLLTSEYLACCVVLALSLNSERLDLLFLAHVLVLMCSLGKTIAF